MKTSVLSLAALTFLFFISINSFAQKKEAAPKKQKDKVLVNRTYTIGITQTGTKSPKQEIDEISFKSGKLNSKFMTTQLHFPAGDYTVVSVDSTQKYVEVTFTSETQNPNGETLKWEGTITDDVIEGKMAVTAKKGKTTGEYIFSGNEQVKKGAKKK